MSLFKPLVSFACVLTLLSSQPYVSDLLLYPLEYLPNNNSTAYIPKDDPAKHEILLVLACNYYSEPVHYPEVSKFPSCSLQRLVQAAITQKQTNLPIVITGGFFLKNEKITYAEVAKDFLVSLGVAETSIITITKGYDTVSELDAVKHIVENKTVGVISSASHHFRIKRIAKDQNISMQFIAVDYLSSGALTPYVTWPSSLALKAFQRAIYEYLAIVKYALNGKL